MNSKIKAALSYLVSALNLDKDKEINISIKGDKVYVSDENLATGTTYDMLKYINPVSDIMDHVSEQMCVDCLQIDYYLVDPFFLSLAKAYIASLFIDHGTKVPISRELAYAVVKHNLSNARVMCTDKTGRPVRITFQSMHGLEFKQFDNFYLIVK